MGSGALFKAILRHQAPRDPSAGVEWSLPTSDGPGAWMPEVATIVPFKAGYHLHTESALLVHHLGGGPRVWLAEGRGASVASGAVHLIYPSARLVRELDWSFSTRLRVALATARDALSRASVVEDRLREALDAAEALAEPTLDALRALDERLLRPTWPRGFARWEEEVELLDGTDPRELLTRRAACSRYATVSAALTAEPPSTLVYGHAAIEEPGHGASLESAFRERVLAALSPAGSMRSA